MQNLKPTLFTAVADRPSAVSDVVDRVVSIAPAPLLPGEKQADYADIAVRVVRDANPKDAIEEFLIRDVIDLIWEILRLRRIKAGVLRSSTGSGVKRILSEIGHPWSEKNELGEAFAAGDVQARKHVEAILKKAGLTIDEVAAQTMDCKL